jgi:PTS system mannose-specific IIA component
MDLSTPVGVLVVTHGQLAAELVQAARTIVAAPLPHFRALSVGWNDEMDRARELVRRAISECDLGRGVLVLTDMFGGTPTNLCLACLAPGRVEIVTGVNLPMVVKTANLQRDIAAGRTLRQLADRIANKGRDSVKVAGAMLEPDEHEGT